ncbi:HTH_Tnp_Tc3_2 domain-containing protein [Trichonephila clavipes]|nr:HTH_Tnp_Tc3_2 domain-containing protein [Trichonephila clavipes]
MFGDNFAKELQSIPLSNDTVSRRIDDIAEDVEQQLFEFERGRIIGLKEGGWANRRIARDMGRRDAAIIRCWQEWVNNGKFLRHDCSGRPRDTSDQEDRFIIRSTVTALDSSLSTIRRATHTRGSTMTIHK